MSISPRIHLAIDNCFASKRWTDPQEWMREIKDVGVACAEASADTELDPLYLGREYLRRWRSAVERASSKTGVRVVNLYSGHGTYATLGLAHTDRQVRDRFRDEWLKPMVTLANEVGAGMGFFCHAFPQQVLSSAERFANAFTRLIDDLAEIARFNAAQSGPATIGVEQMYTPHQVPWTVEQTIQLLRDVYAHSGAPFYITVDVGHQSGQHRFLAPTNESLAAAADAISSGASLSEFWLAPDSEYAKLEQASAEHGTERVRILDEIMDRVPEYSYLYAQASDGDPYTWLRRLAGYSPIVHLQQTTGTSSRHLPFNEETNRSGIIRGNEVLAAIAACYAAQPPGGLPPFVEDIYLTIEVFAATAEKPTETRKKLRESVDYWREFVPEDGLPLERLVKEL